MTSSNSIHICSYLHTLCALCYCVVVESTGQHKGEPLSRSKIEEAAVELAKLKARMSKICKFRFAWV